MKPIETWNKKKGWNVLKHEIEKKGKWSEYVDEAKQKQLFDVR